MSSDTPREGSLLYDVLSQEIEERDWEEGRKELDKMVKLYASELPAEYEEYFPKSLPKHLVHLIRLAWDDLATSVGRMPDLRGEPLNHLKKELEAVGLLEKIGFSYLRHAKPSGKIFMRRLAWWILAQRAVVLVLPDFEHKMPEFVIRDPRTCYPGIKRIVDGQIVELSDLMFKSEILRSEAVHLGLAHPTKREKGPSGRAVTGGASDPKKIAIIEYIDDKKWMVASEEGLWTTAEHNLGIVPGWVFQNSHPSENWGIGQFSDQISLMVAVSRLVTAKVALADRTVNPVMWVRGHQGKVRLGPWTLNKLGPDGEMGVLNPPTTFQVDQDIAMLERFSRILNKNPEVRQGEVATKSTYTSAKTLEQLAEAIDTTVGAYWDIISVGLQKCFEAAFAMDEGLWAKFEKSISGVMKGQRFQGTYIPSKDISGRRFINIDHGFGLGGYQGFLMHVQAKDAGLMSKRRAMEQMPGVSDVDEELRAIELEMMDDAGHALFAQQAATGQMDILLWSDLRSEMAKEGHSLNDAIQEYHEQIQTAADAAAAQESGPEPITAPTAPEEAPQEEAPLPGIPAEVVVG